MIMPEKETTLTIIDAFQALPERIKDWASSDSTTFLIAEINNRLGLKEGRRRIIPSLILRLITQNLEPQDFINELANELAIGFQAAKSIADDIENHILRSIENELRRDAGVDVKLIRFGQLRPSKPLEIPKPMPAQEKIKPTEPIVDLQSFQIKKGAAKLKPAETEPEPPPATPFILHQADQITQTAIKSSLNIKVPDFSRPAAEKPSAPKPISVQIEIPSARVVHYSDFRTPISQDGAPKPQVPAAENIVDLRKIIKQESGPNTVDLRNQNP